MQVCVTVHTCACWCFIHVRMRRLRAQPRRRARLLTAVPKLTRLAVHSGQQQPGSLPDIIAVHGEAASVLSVDHRHTHPLHQRRQHHERPVGGDRSTCSGHQRLTLNFSHAQLLSVPEQLATKIHLIQNLHKLFWRSCPSYGMFENRMNSV